MESNKREIVCEFEGRRRAVLLSGSEDTKKENDNLLAAVKTTFSDLLSPESDSAYYLQVENKKHGLIDLINVQVCEDEKVHLCCWNPNGPKKEVGEVVVN